MNSANACYNSNNYNKIKARRVIVALVLFVLICAIFPNKVVFAGDINSSEAGLIAAASGTFTYDGKTYRAGTAYVNSLTAYLSEDEVDLTAEQCQEAASRMYASVKEGIDQGYLYEVGKEGKKSSDPQKAYDEEDDDEDESVSSGNNGTVKNEGNNSSDSEPDGGSANDVSEETEAGNMDVWDSMSGQTEAKNKLKQRPEQSDADASVKLGDEGIVVTTKDNTINLSKKEQLIPDKIINIIELIAVVTSIFTLLCVCILQTSKCMVFKKPESRKARRGHTKRRRIRRYTRNVLTVTSAVSFIMIYLFIGIYISVFNKDAIMQNMQASGYFRYAYSEYISELANEFKENNTVSETIVSYEDYLFTVKQNSLKILNGETDIRIPDSNVTPYITNIKNSYSQMFSSAGVLFILNALISVVFMVFMDQRRERGIKHTAVATLVASIFIVAVTGYMAFAKPYMHLYIEPDYLYLFIMECILWSVKVMTSISAFAVVFAMLLIGVYISMKNKSNE